MGGCIIIVQNSASTQGVEPATWVNRVSLRHGGLLHDNQGLARLNVVRASVRKLIW